jgi:ribosomal protein S18 acetylase RimI-like enzyme
MEPIRIRNAEPSDYKAIISVVNDWWGGRNMRDMLPKLFFVHFRQTSFIAEASSHVAGFVTGFVSQTFPEEAYIHFIGVNPQFRRENVGRTLCEHFFTVVRPLGCKVVRCVTSPVNRNSVAFWLRMGFATEPADVNVDGLCVAKDYDGIGEDRVLFVKQLGAKS